MTADALTEPKPVGSFPPSGIDVLVVGAGFAGLTSAIECFRKGHNVRVLEKNPDVNLAGIVIYCCKLSEPFCCLCDLGDTYFMGLSATRFIRHWPEMSKEFLSIGLHNLWIETLRHDGTKMIAPRYVRDRYRESGLDPKSPPGTFQMRPLVYKMLMNQTNKLGIKVEFGRKVVEFYEDEARGKAGVHCDDGSSYEADIVIAADGVSSPSQQITGGQVRAASSGRAMWRAAFPISHLEKNPDVKEFFGMVDTPNGPEPIVRTWLA
jgi:2-polyprenyl-6-methoxyphenol hydroxylase-like FAD-dependent oxidoreductase